MPILLGVQRQCLTNLDDWGIRSIREIRDDLDASDDSVWNALRRLETHDLIRRDRRENTRCPELWSLTTAGHIVADWLASGAEAAARAPRLPPKTDREAHTLSEAIELYAEGNRGIKDIAKQLGIGHCRLSAAIKEAGIAVRSRGQNIQPRE